MSTKTESFERDGFARVSEVAKYLGCSTSTVYGLLYDGEIPFVRLGDAHSSLRVRRMDVVRYMESKFESN